MSLRMDGLRVVGYISSMEAGVDREGVFYRFYIVTPSGQEYRVRMRIPPRWVCVGAVVAGVLVRASPAGEDYLIQDARQNAGIPESKSQGFEVITVESVDGQPGVKAIITGSSAGGVTSAPVLSKIVFEKALKIAGGPGYLYFAESHYGKIVVAIQSVREYVVGSRMRVFLEELGE
jgi:hypothetical protein